MIQKKNILNFCYNTILKNKIYTSYIFAFCKLNFVLLNLQNMVRVNKVHPFTQSLHGTNVRLDRNTFNPTVWRRAAETAKCTLLVAVLVLQVILTFPKRIKKILASGSVAVVLVEASIKSLLVNTTCFAFELVNLRRGLYLHAFVALLAAAAPGQHSTGATNNRVHDCGTCTKSHALLQSVPKTSTLALLHWCRLILFFRGPRRHGCFGT